MLWPHAAAVEVHFQGGDAGQLSVLAQNLVIVTFSGQDSRTRGARCPAAV
jgi:hypothetical protein